MAKKPITRTGFTETTAESYLIDSFAIFKNVTVVASPAGGEAKFEGELIGATVGGVTVTIAEEYRDIEVDGPKSKYVGQKVKTSSNATMTANVKEVNERTLAMALSAVAEASEVEGYITITGKTTVESGDYLTNVAAVGTIQGKAEPMVFFLDNALCTSGLELATADNGEASIAMTFEAHVTADQVADDVVPYRIEYPGTI